jgi:hypothetical protein
MYAHLHTYSAALAKTRYKKSEESMYSRTDREHRQNMIDYSKKTLLNIGIKLCMNLEFPAERRKKYFPNAGGGKTCC